MTQEEKAYNYASTQKCTKLQVGEIAKHYNKGYDQAMQDFLEKAEKFLERHKRLSSIFFDGDFITFFREQMMED